MNEIKKEPKTICDMIKLDREFLHEISTPLMVCMGNFEILSLKVKPELTPENLEKWKQIEESLKKLANSLHTHRSFIKSLNCDNL